MAKAKILVVDDEKDIAELVQYNLEKEGYKVLKAFDGETAFRLAQNERPDLIILDVMLPEIDGFEVCRLLKQLEKTRSIPVLMLTAKGEEADIVVGLQLGADDYVTKPFSPKVLLARVKAVLRRKNEEESATVIRDRGPLAIDSAKYKVLYKDKEIYLTNIEFNILNFLARQPGRVFSRDQIMDGAWKDGKFIVDRAVDVHIRAIRKKLGKGAGLVETVRGVGYRFQDNIE